MKRIYFVLLCLLNYTCIFSQWSKIFTLPADEYFKAIGASTDENPWIISSKTGLKNIKIYNSSDAGVTWKKRNANGLPSDVFQWNVQQLYTINTKTAFLCAEIYFNGNGDTGYIFKTTDAGNTWKTVFAYPGFCDITMGLFDAYTGLMNCTVSNSHGVSQQFLYYTKNSGNSWQIDKRNPAGGNTVRSFEAYGRQASMVDYDYFYYTPFYGLSWSKEAVPHPESSQYINLHFENRNYAIVNEGSLTNLYIKRPGNDKWENIGDPTTHGGAVTGLILDKNECWLAVGFDDLKNYYSSDSAKTFSSFIADPQSGFIQMIKATNGNAVLGSTFGNGGRLWMNKRSNQFKTFSDEQKNSVIQYSVSNANLQQNIPNPFNQTTAIAYNLPAQFSSAQIIITDISGKVLKTINVSNSSSIEGSLKRVGVLHLDASTLASGLYNYSLYVDGRLIDTKRMILSR